MSFKFLRTRARARFRIPRRSRWECCCGRPAPVPSRRLTPSRSMSIRPSSSNCPPKVATIVVGNPLIADVTLQSGGIVVVTGKGYGATNFIAMDRAGEVLVDRVIQVEGPTDQLVTVYRGVERESYSCMPICQRRVTLGDGDSYFKSTMDQAGSLSSQASGAAANKADQLSQLIGRAERVLPAGCDAASANAAARRRPRTWLISRLTRRVRSAPIRRNTSTISFEVILARQIIAAAAEDFSMPSPAPPTAPAGNILRRFRRNRARLGRGRICAGRAGVFRAAVCDHRDGASCSSPARCWRPSRRIPRA